MDQESSTSKLEKCSTGLFSNPTLSTVASSLIASTRQTYQSVMNLRGGRRRTNDDNTRKGSNNDSKKVTPGEQELEAFIEVAEYEVHQDPYRGLLSHQQTLETGTKITTPWNACEWGALKPERTLKEDLCPQVIVRHVGHCACPALKAWTRQLQSSKKSNKKSGKKRSRSESTSSAEDDPMFAVGLRPSDPSYRCSCDYNPLCLGSLGGVMNEVLTERCKDMEIRPPPPPKLKETPEPGSPSKLAKKEGEKDVFDAIQSASASKEAKKKEVIDLEAEEKETQKENNAEEEETRTEKASGDVFDFLGDDSTDNNADADNIVKSKALEKNWRISKGDPAQVYTTEDQNQDLSHIQYAPSTTDELKRLRRSLDVDASKIRSYVYRTLRIDHSTRGDGLTVDKYMETLRQWHRSLLFVNPADEEHQVPSDRITLSVPPGIQNLGATCYLNTQLQCLAQNTAFLNGIFSWRIVNSNHSMNSVMTKMQLLLGQMVLGGHSKLSTLDFSNALGLEHDEQQDPNEFARLLFERMDESFQQCDNGGDLANLLQRIFHGLTTYETICMTCGNSSERSEGFMDLNLPIMKRPKEKNSTIKDAFGKGVDTDVQYCLDQYTCAELLEGDNQYFCSTCKCKQDAKRVMKLTELPPVLNVQLSRYVFDRTQYVKKKLTDKVLLPTTLYVEKGGGSKKKYLLCAVMRHQGTSAYRGHYVAETMDWLTGQWFEFNDETVKLLPEGPSCSYDPSVEQNSDSPSEQNSDKNVDDKSGDREKKASTVSGSQDAYNMYYVDEDFLAKNAADSVLRRGRLCFGNKSNGDGQTSRNDVLGDVAKKRETKYAILSE
jgi:ubiquitin carboxyl-terminal hydrolase 48